MKDRRPINIEKIQLAYNAIHLLINVYIFEEAFTLAWFNGYSYRCQAADFSKTGTPMMVN